MDWGILAELKSHFPKRFDKINFFNKIKYIKLFCYRLVSILPFIHPTAQRLGVHHLLEWQPVYNHRYPTVYLVQSAHKYSYKDTDNYIKPVANQFMVLLIFPHTIKWLKNKNATCRSFFILPKICLLFKQKPQSKQIGVFIILFNQPSSGLVVAIFAM